MNTYSYLFFIHICWYIIGLYWLVNAWNTKPTVRKQNMSLRWAYLLALIISFELLYSPFQSLSWLRIQVLPRNDISGIAGCILCATGIIFAIWARYTLGQNWSGNVTLKAGHELISSGPYSIVRHPIYTGALLAILGSVCVTGELKGFIAVVVCFLSFWHKLRMEEDFMITEFPDQYPDYRMRVKMLIPFIF
jgi:protein-S-isoprenylcysteine O-methyltransferase Ste14